MERKKKELLGIILFGVILTAILIGLYLNKPQDDIPDNTCEWENDPFRITYKETVINITLILDFGNGTIETYTEITLTNSYTSSFDLLQSKAEVDFYCRKFGNRLSFFVTGVNGLNEDLSQGKFWQFWVNGQYAQVASNVYVLSDNDVIEWKYGA
jgi:hypothetical protein